VQIRLVIPQSLTAVGGTPLFEEAVRFFEKQGERVFLQDKLLKLSKTLPAIIEGEVAVPSFEAFLLGFPHLDKIVVLTTQAAAKAASIAA
jgi:hypothetical protein